MLRLTAPIRITALLAALWAVGISSYTLIASPVGAPVAGQVQPEALLPLALGLPLILGALAAWMDWIAVLLLLSLSAFAAAVATMFSWGIYYLPGATTLLVSAFLAASERFIRKNEQETQ